jgi:dipeptidase
MRDHFEGTPLDMTQDVMAGPWSSPIRPRAKSFTSEGKRYFRERPVSTQQAGFAVVAQMRSWLPDAVGGVYYFNCDDPGMVAYVPVYCGVTQIPEAFDARHNQNGIFDEKGAFWLCNWVSNMVYPRYSAMMPALLEAREELERYFAADQAAVEAQAQALTPGEQITFLNARTAAYTEKMMDRWSRLARELIVRFNDQPGSYDQTFWDAVARDTGDRYRIPE